MKLVKLLILAVFLTLAASAQAGIGQVSGGGGTITGGGTAPTGGAGGDLTGTYPNPTIGLGRVSSSNITDGAILNVDVNASAAIAFSKMAALTVSRACVLDASGFVSAAAVTGVELGYVSGVTSAIQTQFTGKEPAITATTSADFYRGDKSFQTLNSAAVPELTNLYFTEPRVRSSLLTGFLSGAGAVAATDSVLQAVNKLDGNIAGKEPTVTATTSADYYRGDKSFQTLNSAAVAELTNLYFTDARSIASPITGYVSGAGVVAATDTILQAVNKLDGNTAAKEPTVTATTSADYYRGDKTFQTLNSAAVAELTNLYFTDARSIASPITGFVQGAGAVAATDTLLQAINKLDGNTAANEPAITAGTTAQYWRGDKSFQTLNSAAVAELTNLYFTDARSIASPITGFVQGAGVVAATDTILQSINKLDGNVAAKEPTITATTSADYYRGDKSFQTLNSAAVAELTNLYFTDARSIASPLTGYVSGAGTVAATDTILQAVNKLNGNDALKLPLAGGTVTGNLVVNGSASVGTLLKLVPITTINRDIDYPTPAKGDVIFNDTLNQPQYYNGSQWLSF